MKKLPIILAVALTPLGAIAQTQPFEFSYQWTLSGKEYVTVGTPLRELGRGLTFDAVAGYEVRGATTPMFGFGASYTFYEDRGFYGKAGAFVLFPQSNRPDVGFGIMGGVRF